MREVLTDTFVYTDTAAGELIFYQRADQGGPKTSTYSIVPTDRPGELRDALANAYGIRNTVRKTRHLYLAGRTRIHIDEVAALGLRSLGEQPSVVAGWFNWLRSNAAARLLTRPVAALAANRYMEKQTPEELR